MSTPKVKFERMTAEEIKAFENRLAIKAEMIPDANRTDMGMAGLKLAMRKARRVARDRKPME